MFPADQFFVTFHFRSQFHIFTKVNRYAFAQSQAEQPSEALKTAKLTSSFSGPFIRDTIRWATVTSKYKRNSYAIRAIFYSNVRYVLTPDLVTTLLNQLLKTLFSIALRIFYYCPIHCGDALLLHSVKWPLSRSPWMKDQTIARPWPTQDSKKVKGGNALILQ